MLKCPHCGRNHEYHDGSTPDAKPKPGDVSVCWSCRRLGIYTNFGIRVPTPEEEAEILSDPEVRSVLGLMVESYTPTEASELRWRESSD
jgi:hypothetical protein